MKDAIGLILFGLLLRYGLADVSHLGNSGHSQYLPPPIQNLPIEQDNNGLDSEPNNAAGYLPPLNGLRNSNQGYLPPYQNPQQYRNSDDHWSQRQYKDAYNPSVQVSYHNDLSIRGPQNDQVESSDQQDDESDEQQDDDSYEDHVEIDQQQLEPIFPSNFPVQAYLPPTGGRQNYVQSQAHPIVRPSRGEGISLAPYHHNNPSGSSPRPFSSPLEESPTPLTPVESARQQVLPPPHNGYQYLPPAQPANSLYPNQGLRVTELPIVTNELQQGRLNGYLPPSPIQSNQLSPTVPTESQNYLPPIQSSLSNNPRPLQQDYLPPNRVANPTQIVNQEVSQNGYLPPNRQDLNLNQYYLPPSPWNHKSQSIQNFHPSNDQQVQRPQDYLPPSQPNSGIQLNRRPKTRSQLESTRVTNGHEEVRQPHQQLQQDYLPPLNVLTNSSLSNEVPRNQLTVRGHVNVPLPIPQVGYFFIPGVVREVPSLNEAKRGTLRPALNIPDVIRPEQIPPPPQPTQRISTPEYTKSFLLQKPNPVTEQKSSSYVITPSIETRQNSLSEGLHAVHDQLQQVSPQTPIQQALSDGIRQLSPKQTVVNYTPQNQGYLPPLNHNHQVSPLLEQNLNQQGYIPPENPETEASEEIEEQNQQPFVPSSFTGNGYLPPNNEYHSQQQNQIVRPQSHDQLHDHRHLNTNVGRGYLPPVQPEKINQITSLQTYMNQVHPNDRYGSSIHSQAPPPHEKGHPPPPAPAMFKKPSVTSSYAPEMAYQAPAADHHQDSPSKDNSGFPLEELFGLQENDIEGSELAELPRGHVRTVQIINSHTNTVRNIKVLETADQSGVKTFKILGHSHEDPMGDHRVVRIISKGPHPDGILQTVKIFNDHKEVELPTQNAYLPPPRAKETYTRVLRDSHEAYRSH